jgi:hypothetical protein
MRKVPEKRERLHPNVLSICAQKHFSVEAEMVRTASVLKASFMSDVW